MADNATTATTTQSSNFWTSLSSFFNNGSSIFLSFQKNKQMQLEIDRLRVLSDKEENKQTYDIIMEQLRNQEDHLRSAEISRYVIYGILFITGILLFLRKEKKSNQLKQY